MLEWIGQQNRLDPMPVTIVGAAVDDKWNFINIGQCWSAGRAMIDNNHNR